MTIADKLRGLFTRGPAEGSDTSRNSGPTDSPLVQGEATIIVTQSQTTFVSSLQPQVLAGFAGIELVSWLDPPEVRDFEKLPSAALLGVLLTPKDKAQPRVLLPNREFTEFMHFSIAAIGPTLPSLCAQARSHGTGTIFLVDGRFEAESKKIVDNDKLPREEIIGIFGISDGTISQASYLRSANYKIWTKFGRARLLPDFRSSLMERLKMLPIPISTK